jgi:putative Ca2+/H+ antiporter (TMEM165/GDT1 family)
MRYNKVVIFLGSIISLIVMTIISAMVGFGITSFIPPIYTYYIAIAIMFIFGFKMFWDAYR